MILKFPKKQHDEICKLCGRDLGDEYADLKYEVTEENGVSEVSFGKICWNCADVLEGLEEQSEMAPENEDDI